MVGALQRVNHLTAFAGHANCERTVRIPPIEWAYAEDIMKTWLTVAEGATYSGVSRDTIYTACERRELRHARIGGRRAIRLKPEWIDAWLERFTRGTNAAPAIADVSPTAASRK